MQISEAALRHRGLLKVINEVLEALWGASVNHLVKVINEVLESSWAFGIKKVIGELGEVREGEFQSVLVITEIISDAIQVVGAIVRMLAFKVVYVIGESVTVYDSLTRLLARAVLGVIKVVGDTLGISESWLTRKVRDRRITRWLERVTRR